MMSRLTILLSVVVFSLSGLVVYNIYSINKAAKTYEPPPISATETNPEVTNPQENEDINEGIEPNENTGEEIETIIENTTSNIQKYNLSEDELYSLLGSNNPFGNSLSKNNTILKEKIDKQVEETRQIAQEELDAVKKVAKKEDVVEIAELKAKKYDIPSEWIIQVIENTSQYQTNLSTIKEGVSRKGIMQIREDKLAFISESIGVFYEPNIENNIETNIEMGAYYLSYLSKQNADKHYIFTAYDKGPTGAKTVYEKSGSYVTEFSKKILSEKSSE